MKCNNCEAIFGSQYKVCPSCGSSDVAQERRVIQPTEIVKYEPVSAYVMGSEIAIGEIE